MRPVAIAALNRGVWNEPRVAAASQAFTGRRPPLDVRLVLVGNADGAAIDESRPDSPISIELRLALDCADQHGIPFVWVNDPEELYPYYERFRFGRGNFA